MNINVFGYSKEYVTWIATTKCPSCGRRGLFKLKQVRPDGSKLNTLDRITAMRNSMVHLAGVPTPASDGAMCVECPQCHYRCPMFAGAPVQDVRGQDSLAIQETNRSEEFIGSEQRIINNAKSAASVSRDITFSKEWSQSYVVELHDKYRGGANLSLGSNHLASLQLTAEKAIEKQYSVTQNTKQVYTDKITLNVPPHCTLRLLITWKRIWQHGSITFRDAKGTVLNISFKVVVGVTFDQEQSTT